MLRMDGESYWQAGINKKLPQKEAYLTGTYRGHFMARATHRSNTPNLLLGEAVFQLSIRPDMNKAMSIASIDLITVFIIVQGRDVLECL
jgi:hypothetical protein